MSARRRLCQPGLVLALPMALLLALTVGASALQAQIACTTAADPAAVRDQGLTELVADLRLECVGGVPTPSGADLPRFQVLVLANTAITSKELPATVGRANGWNEALLLVDDPSAPRQRPCAPLDGAPPCPAIQGDASLPNVFPARRVQDNAVVFSGVAFDPPGPNGARKLRITNIRVNAAARDDRFSPDQVRLTVQIFPATGGTVAVTPPERPVARATPGLLFSLRTVDDEPVPAAAPALLATPATLPDRDPAVEQSFVVRFEEGFAGAFRRRNLATSAAPGGSGGKPSRRRLLDRIRLLQPRFRRRQRLEQAGLANTGTRLKAVLEDIPANVAVWVSLTEIVKPSAAGRARTSPTPTPPAPVRSRRYWARRRDSRGWTPPTAWRRPSGKCSAPTPTRSRTSTSACC